MDAPYRLLLILAALMPAAGAAQTIPAPPPAGTLVPERIEPAPRPRDGERGPTPRSMRPPAADPGIVAPTPVPPPDPSRTPLVPPSPPGQPRPEAPR